ncbi:MAG: hypothetical protein ACPGVT_12505 [Maricaulaceae bacterium]
MNRKFATISLTLATVSLLSGCNDSEVCFDTGGLWDKENVKCECEAYKEDGFCKNMTLPETFISGQNPNHTIYIQKRGNKKRIEVNGEKVADAEIFNGSFAEHIISQSTGLAISVPDYPDTVRNKWNFGGCTFEKSNEKPARVYAIEQGLFGFKSYCEYKKVRTSYVVTKQLNIVAFSILSPDETTETAVPMKYVNGRFSESKSKSE